MNNELIFAPVLGHIFLVFALYTLLLVCKLQAKKTQEINLKEAALNCKAWPDEVLKVSNNLDNQFEAPVLFYTLVVATYLLSQVSTLTLILAWLFFLSRCAHAFVHVTSNYVPVRMKLFALGLLALAGLAINIACALLPFCI